MDVNIKWEKVTVVTGEGKPRARYYAYYILPDGSKKYLSNEKLKRNFFDQDEYDELTNKYSKTPEAKKPATATSTSETTPVTKSTSTTTTTPTPTPTSTVTKPSVTASPRTKTRKAYVEGFWDDIRTKDPNWKNNWRRGLDGFRADMANNSYLNDAWKNKTKDLLGKANNQYAKDALNNIPPDEFLDLFMKFQNQVYSVGESIPDLSKFDPEGLWDKHRSQYLSKMKDLRLEALTPEQTAAVQAMYIALQELKKDPEFSEYLENYVPEQHGVSDEPMGKISSIDGWLGNTTIGQGILKAIRDQTPDVTKKQEDVGDITPDYGIEEGYASPKRAPFWKQDVIGLGRDLSNWMSINKYLPWAEKPEFFEADPTFYDPNRALAANAEQASIASDAIAMYSGPQQTSARIAKTQADASRNAANIISEYDKRNVDVANRFEMFNAQGRNQAARLNANIDNELYKGWVIANQQYDNSKRAMKNNFINTYINALTNRAYTSNLNDLYPEFSIDPASGGFLNFTPNTNEIQPTQGKNPFKDIMALKNIYPDVDINEIAKIYTMMQKDLIDTPTSKSKGSDLMALQFGKR